MKHNDSLLKTYISEIQRYPLLTLDEELELSRKIQDGDRAAFEKLVNSNLRLCVAIAKKYVGLDFPLIDLIQEGNLGLLTAAERYSFSFGVRFSTYACWWIRQSINRAVAKKSRLVRLPGRKEYLARKIRRVQAELSATSATPPTFKEIALELGLEENCVAEIYALSEPAFSLEAEMADSGGLCMKDVLADSSVSPEDQFLEQCGKTRLRDMVNTLKKKESYVVFERFGFNDDRKKRTFSYLGKKLGVTAESVRQTEMRALKKLRASSCKDDFFAVSP